LQVSYNFNMVAINKLRPERMGLKPIIQAYVDFQKEVITKRTQFNLQKAEARLHIVDGLIKALSILDQVIKTIRGSKDKKDAKHNLVERFDFSEKQAESIVSLQLYRLTNTDVTELKTEAQQLNESIAEFNQILNDPAKLSRVLSAELRKVKKQ
ncbi:DNA topoisomerase IV subunit A, partial [Pediococcus acidilactici]|nr:DNA topoisomerase IV subunit A [Pediococcus acidilactici]